MFDTPPPNLPVEPTTQSLGSEPGSSSASAPPMIKKEPEDIFSDLESVPDPIKTAETIVPEAPSRPSALKLILIAAIILAVVGGAGTSVWYFLIRPDSVEQPIAEIKTTAENPPAVTAESEPVVEIPIALPDEPKAPTDFVPNQNPNLPPPQAITPETKLAPKEGIDTDEDGLTDAEEAIASTDANKSDTDLDGYNDGAELRSGYDPAAAAASLADSKSFRQAEIASSWTVLLPTMWIVGPSVSNSNDFAIRTGTPTTFEVHIDAKTVSTTFSDWFASNITNLSQNELLPMKTKAGYPAWQTLDKATTFIVSDSAVLTITYQLNTATTYEYRALYSHVIETIRSLRK